MRPPRPRRGTIEHNASLAAPLSPDRIRYIQSLYELAYLLETNPLLPTPSGPLFMPTRVFTVWSDAELERMVAEVREGMSWDAIAHAHGRTVGAIRARAAKMQSAGAVAETLHALLVADQDYDWRGHLARSQVRALQRRAARAMARAAVQDITAEADDLG